MTVRYCCALALLLAIVLTSQPTSRAEQPGLQGDATGVVQVRAEAERLVVRVRGAGEGLEVVELAPYQTMADVATAPVVTSVAAGREASEVVVPRFDGGRDRLDAGFVARRQVAGQGEAVGGVRYVEAWAGVSRHVGLLPAVASKKGLQVQMVDDALALGVRHAALNVNLGALIDWQPGPESLAWKLDGETFYFRRAAVQAIPVKRLSEAGVRVNLILLNYVGRDPIADRVMRHPAAVGDPPNQISAFNLTSREGYRAFRACVEFLAERFSDPNGEHGQVAGYIIGNEVNSHWYWYNLGPASPETVAEEYLKAVRVAHAGVRKHSAHARVFVSLDHFWTGQVDADRLHCFGSKWFLEHFNRLSKAGGDFDWDVAFHPYPENLFEPRTWLDQTALPRDDALRITFKNLEQLLLFLSRDELRCRGAMRRVILSEQGFHTPDGPEGELWQAAGFCYAYAKVARLDGIEAFILHRHVDHAREGGLNLGLWSRQPESIATPLAKKRIYEAFRQADTAQWEEAFRFALPVIGIADWSDVMPPAAKPSE